MRDPTRRTPLRPDGGAADRDEHRQDHRDDHGDGHGDHPPHHAHDLSSVRTAVLTVSSSRAFEDDVGGDEVVAGLEDAGHEVVVRDVVVDDLDAVRERVGTYVSRDDVDAVVTTGGTGVTPDDVTVEAVEPLFEKSLPGFGELFRSLSRAEIGSRVVATRATAGVVEGVPVFSLPGSANAARLGTREIVAPEVGHLAGLARLGRDGDDLD